MLDEKSGRGRRICAIGGRFSSGGGDEGRMDGVNALENLLFLMGPKKQEGKTEGGGHLMLNNVNLLVM